MAKETETPAVEQEEPTAVVEDASAPEAVTEEVAAATEEEAAAPVETAAEISHEAVEDAPVEMPKEISPELPHPNRASAEARMEVWLSDARHFFQTLEHDFEGEAGEIVAFMRGKLSL
jgi:hypothetical protein